MSSDSPRGRTSRRCASPSSERASAASGAAYAALACARRRASSSATTRGGRPRPHGAPRRPRARHRLHRPQRAELPAPDAPLPRARRPGTGGGDVVLGQLRRVRARVVGRAAVRAAADASSTRGFLSLARRDRALAAHGATVARRARTTSERRSTSTCAERRYSRAVPRRTTSCRSPRRSGRPRPSGRSTSRPPTRSASSSNHGMLGFGRHRWRTVTGGSRHVRPRDARAGSAGRVRLGLGVRAVRRDAGRRRAADRRRRGAAVRRASSSPPTPTRRCALLADPSDEEQRVLGAFRYDARTTSCCTPTRGSCRGRAARAPRGTTSSSGRGERPTVTYYLNRLQASRADEHCA